MTNSTKKVYLVYGGDDVPYEPTHVIAAFLDKEKAQEYLNIQIDIIYWIFI